MIYYPVAGIFYLVAFSKKNNMMFGVRKLLEDSLENEKGMTVINTLG